MRTLGVGARVALTRSLLAGGLLGVGEQGKSGDRVALRYAEADVMLRIADHAGVIGSARYLPWHRLGEAYWYAPVTVGVQLF